ncbi:MAG: SUMF1/EgtB/PvdO family nonheme iron enzyme [Leptolyngbyaceae cyanobacterium SL_5_14]|nr:SUMF1/EgtB/PvdO family nonheme iron enzyme [Leptolyngbyaceae cyanobacterium SL_5_14]
MVENAVKLFFSYAHEDEALRDKLAKHLSSLERRGIISNWHDRKLAAGSEWDNEIKSQLESADIILLLISSNFMASKYCHEVEIPIALKRHNSREACVVPVILSPCDWYDERFAKLQAFPKDGEPVTLWKDPDAAFTSVAQGIRSAAERLREYRDQQLKQKETELEKREANRERYRQKVEEFLSDDEEISPVERLTLRDLQHELNLTPEEVEEIEDHACKPYNEYRESLERYEKDLRKLVEQGYYPFSEQIDRDLENRQRYLGLKTEDAIKISKPILDEAELIHQAKQEQWAETERLQKLEQQQKQKQEEYNAKLERYRQEFAKAAKAEYPLNQYVVENLKKFQTQLELKDEDVAQIEQWICDSVESKQREKPKQQPEAEQQYQTDEQHKQIFEFDVITVNKKGLETHHTRKTTEFFAEDLGNGLLLEMVKIPSGTFEMGSPKDQGNSAERPQHSVTVSAFFMGKFPITQVQWRVVTGLPRVNVHLDPEPANFKGDNRPVEQVSWYEAVEFCDRLSQKTGRIYRLPTEAEWEYACRAGTTTPFHFGEALPEGFPNCNTGNVVTFYTKALSSSTANVGSFNFANDFGLYDMHGNVWEWCLDHWHDNYQNAPSNGQAWVSKDEGQSRVLRGGSWDYSPRDCRSASRIRYAPNFRLNVIGFRVVMEQFE